MIHKMRRLESATDSGIGGGSNGGIAGVVCAMLALCGMPGGFVNVVCRKRRRRSEIRLLQATPRRAG